MSNYTTHEDKATEVMFYTLFNSPLVGVARLDEFGNIRAVNHTMETMLDISNERVAGAPIAEIVKDLSRDVVEDVLQRKTDAYSTFLNIGPAAAVAVIEPIIVNESITGALLSCSQVKRLQRSDAEAISHGYRAYGTLDAIEKQMPELKKIVKNAKLFAGSSVPILINGNSAEDVEELCQGIHNYSLRKNGPYVTVNMVGIDQGDQTRVLFGELGADGVREGGLVSRAHQGTLVIRAVDKLTLQAQYHLLRLMNRHYRTGESVEPTRRADVRCIFCTSKNMTELQAANLLRLDFHYLLHTFRLEIPDLFQRKEDIEKLFEKLFAKYLRIYSRYHVLSPGARRVILEYAWQGHRLHLDAFVECMILTVGKRTISEDFVRRLLNDLYGYEKLAEPSREPREMFSRGTEFAVSEQERIQQVLTVFGGNRALTAEKLGMSTTTLWRKMKLYGLLPTK